jgi:hypothetical protein
MFEIEPLHLVASLIRGSFDLRGDHLRLIQRVSADAARRAGGGGSASSADVAAGRATTTFSVTSSPGSMSDLKSLEHPTLKVPYEVLNKKFRAAQKNIDREAAHLQSAIADMEKQLQSKANFAGPGAATEEDASNAAGLWNFFDASFETKGFDLPLGWIGAITQVTLN